MREAVLLMAYGSPGSLEDVAAYYTHIRGGREPTPERIDELKARYGAIGGASPLLEITRRQADALSRRLDRPVYVGMKHWHPFIAETMARMHADGITHATALALAPHYSRMSIGAYLAAVRGAVEHHGGPQMTCIESWHLHPRFIAAVARRVRAALERTARPSDAFVIFTAHSLPRRIVEAGDPYVEQLGASSRAVAAAAGVTRWSFAFQSASDTGVPWLGPDVLNALDQLPREGVAEAVVCPIGFVADHLEVLYDLDIEARERAQTLGLRLLRTPSLNDDPDFIDALGAVIISHRAAAPNDERGAPEPAAGPALPASPA